MKAIVFLHGIGGTRFEYAPLLSLARQSGYMCVEFAYSQTFGQVSQEEIIATLHVFLKTLKINPLAFVGFSMGGVIATAFANAYVKKPIPIFVGSSPMNGTLDCYLFLTPGFKQLRPGSPFISSLQTTSHRIYSVWTPFDLVVVPGWSGKVGVSKMILWPAHSFSMLDNGAQRHFKEFLRIVKN